MIWTDLTILRLGGRRQSWAKVHWWYMKGCLPTGNILWYIVFTGDSGDMNWWYMRGCLLTGHIWTGDTWIDILGYILWYAMVRGDSGDMNWWYMRRYIAIYFINRWYISRYAMICGDSGDMKCWYIGVIFGDYWWLLVIHALMLLSSSSHGDIWSDIWWLSSSSSPSSSSPSSWLWMYLQPAKYLLWQFLLFVCLFVWFCMIKYHIQPALYLLCHFAWFVCLFLCLFVYFFSLLFSFLCLIIYNMISHPARLISAMSLCLGDPALQPLRTATQRFVNLMMTRRMLMMMTMKGIDNGVDDHHDHV